MRLATLALLAALVTACGGGDDYCDAVADHQAELTDVTASGSPHALLDALPVLRDLQEQAPGDIRDEWDTLVGALEELTAALQAAGLDPATYDAGELPEEVTDDQRRRIEAAGAALADPAVVRAFDGVQQQAKDVCHTPLSL